MQKQIFFVLLQITVFEIIKQPWDLCVYNNVSSIVFIIPDIQVQENHLCRFVPGGGRGRRVSPSVKYARYLRVNTHRNFELNSPLNSNILILSYNKFSSKLIWNVIKTGTVQACQNEMKFSLISCFNWKRMIYRVKCCVLFFWFSIVTFILIKLKSAFAVLFQIYPSNWRRERCGVKLCIQHLDSSSV